MKVKTHYILICLVSLFAIHSSAEAYWHWHCDGKNLRRHDKRIKWRAGKNSFVSGTGWPTALTTANGRWNQAPCRFTFSIRNWNETYVGFGNGQTEIFFTNNQDFLDGAPARCVYYYNCGSAKINEVNVVFDAGVKYSKSDYQYSKTPYGGDWRPWGTTAMHEFGHGLGLAHNNGTYNIMGEDWDHIHANDAKVRHYAGEDAGNGAVHIYGKSQNSVIQDVGVTH